MKKQAVQMQNAPPSPFSLWIVDDDATLVELLVDHLCCDSRIQDVRGFISPAEFLEALCVCKEPPDVVVLDIRMQQMNGLSLLRKIRSTNPRNKVVMCSALNDTNALLDALAEGASGFLVKPATADELVNAGLHAVAGLRPLNAAASTTLVGYVTPPRIVRHENQTTSHPDNRNSSDFFWKDSIPNRSQIEWV